MLMNSSSVAHRPLLQLIPHLKAVFHVGRVEHDSFSYVGMKFITVDATILMQQESYINLQPIHMNLKKLQFPLWN